MKKLFALLVLVVLIVNAKPPSGSSGWRKVDTNLSRWTFSNLSTPQSGDTATLPIQSTYANYTAFLLTNAVGNISGKTITATFTIQPISGDPGYVWGGYNIPQYGNYGTRPEAGLYFSTDTGFPRSGAPPLNEADNYWYTALDRIVIDDSLGTVTLSVSVQPGNWSNAYGALGSDASHVAGFLNACQGGGVIGLALASDHFFDIGVATTNGTAVLHLHNFSIQ